MAAGLISGLYAFALTRGADEQQLATAAGLSPATLGDPAARAPFSDYVRLTRAAKHLTRDPALSLRFGEMVPMTQLSAFAFAAPAPAETLDTVALLNRFGRLVADVGPADRERFSLDHQEGELWLCDRRPNANDFPDLTESTFARMAANARRRGLANPVLGVEVTHPRPEHHAEYARVFGGAVRFEARRNALRVDERMLSTPTPPEKDYGGQVLAAHAESLMRDLDRRAGLRSVVEAELSRSTPITSPKLEAVASRLGLSARTLARRLAGEGVTFDQVFDAVRRDRALKHLLEERRSIAETAYLTGFSDRSAFSRAFRRWTGTTPGQASATDS